MAQQEEELERLRQRVQELERDLEGHQKLLEDCKQEWHNFLNCVDPPVSFSVATLILGRLPSEFLDEQRRILAEALKVTARRS